MAGSINLQLERAAHIAVSLPAPTATLRCIRDDGGESLNRVVVDGFGASEKCGVRSRAASCASR